MHNARAGKKGVFLAGHNDRDFNTANADHIDGARTSENKTWYWCQGREPGLTFEEAERKFYEARFKRGLDARNERYRKQRHPERMKSMDEYRRAKSSCPEETILQIGRAGDTVSDKLLWSICLEQIRWEQQTFPNVKVLDVALHVDEEGAPHLHKRQVWTYDSNDGPLVGQNKALQEMGLERPDKGKKEGRYNNAKMSYTQQCREHFLQLCRAKGLEIEAEPKEASETGLSLLEYQRRQEQKQLEETRAEQRQAGAGLKAINDAIKQKMSEFDKSVKDSTKTARKAKEEAETAKEEAKKTRGDADTYAKKTRGDADAYAEKIRGDADTYALEKAGALNSREKELDDKEASISKRESKLNTAKGEFEKKRDKAYWDIQKQKEDLKTAAEEELERRIQQYKAGDFGDAVRSLESSVEGMSR